MTVAVDCGGERRDWTARVLRLAQTTQALSAEVEQRAVALEKLGMDPLDALHVASAETAQADYVLTCDDRLPRRYRGVLTVLNPVEFILGLGNQL